MSTGLLYDKYEPENSVDLLGRLAFLAETSDDAEQKSALLWDLTDFFLESADDCTDGDRDFFGDLMEELAFSLEMTVREELARKIAAEALAPRGLVVRLANDEIPVARPVLEQSPVLTDDDLVEISQNKGQEHLLAITRRKEELSFRLTTVLAERGDSEVITNLIQNPNAKLAPETVNHVMSRGAAAEPLQSELIKRHEVPQEVLFGLLKNACDNVRREVERKLTATDKLYLEEVVDSLESEFHAGPDSFDKQAVDALLRRNALNEAALLRFLRENKPMRFLLGFAAMLQADPIFARKIISDPTGQLLVVACRACKISFNALKEIASSPMTKPTVGPRALLDLSRSYQRICEADAQEMLRALKLRNKMLSA